MTAGLPHYRNQARQDTVPADVFILLATDPASNASCAILTTSLFRCGHKPAPSWADREGGFVRKNGDRHFVTWTGVRYPLIPEDMEN